MVQLTIADKEALVELKKGKIKMEDAVLGQFQRVKERGLVVAIYNMSSEKIAALEETIVTTKYMGPIGNFEEV